MEKNKQFTVRFEPLHLDHDAGSSDTIIDNGSIVMIEKDFEFFTDNFDSITAGHEGEYVVIKEADVLGYYKTEQEAFLSMQGVELGTYLILQCSKNTITPQEFHSRAVFA